MDDVSRGGSAAPASVAEEEIPMNTAAWFLIVHIVWPGNGHSIRVASQQESELGCLKHLAAMHSVANGGESEWAVVAYCQLGRDLGEVSR